jgi:predicted ester cyclase/heme-degrading monooxygenase HmoA
MEKLGLFLRLLAGALLRGPGRLAAADRYLRDWNQHAVDALARFPYQDPLTGETIEGEALRAHAAMLLKAFPDLRFELDGPLTAGESSVAARYVLHATHNGPLPGRIGFSEIAATGRRIALPGALFIEFSGARIQRVINRFDQVALGEALGFQALILPQQMGDYGFGGFYRLNRGNSAPPEAIGTTWITVKGGEAPFEHVATITKNALEHLSEQKGFITGIVGARLPDADGEGYGFTVSAWESLADMDQILPDEAHRDVVQQFMKENVAYATHSRVYQLVRTKPVMIACEACGKKNNAHNKTGRCSRCEAELESAPPYW